MRAAAAVVIVAATIVVAGCGGSHERRDAVNRYFDGVDAAQQPMRLEGGAINKALARFSTVRNTPSETRALVHAQAVIERVGAKLRRVQPPEDARRLHADLVRVYALQAGVVSELVEMTHFVPRYDAALVPLKSAHANLAIDLTHAKGWQPIAHAFARYRQSLAAALAQLTHLSAPPTMRPGFNTERTALRRSVALCATIETALAKHDAKQTTAGIRALSSLGTQNGAAQARRDQIAAAKAYNARLARISSLTAKIGRERDALVGELG
jgi:hypothetical protein